MPMVDYDYSEENEDTGEIKYYATYQVGGKDEDGEYYVVLEGPAEGERVYF